MTGHAKDIACTGIKLYLDCCGVNLAGDVDTEDVMRRLGDPGIRAS